MQVYVPTFSDCLSKLSRIVRHLRRRVETLEPYPLAYMWDVYIKFFLDDLIIALFSHSHFNKPC